MAPHRARPTRPPRAGVRIARKVLTFSEGAHFWNVSLSAFGNSHTQQPVIAGLEFDTQHGFGTSNCHRARR
jgi:hypothetical protein